MPSLTLFCSALLQPRAPAPDPDADSRLPALELLLARGAHRADACDDDSAWLCRRFGMAPRDEWPVAALSLEGDGGAAGNGYWLRADPVYLDVRHQHLILQSTDSLEIDADEYRDLAQALREYFSAEGLEFVDPAPGSWYLRLPASPDLRTVPLASAIGRDIDRLLPQGRDRIRWHRLFNETQMLLHQHPVNLAREEQGRPMINSLWFWGGGRLPEVSRPFNSVTARSALVRGLARVSGVDAHEDHGYRNPDSGHCLVELAPANADTAGERELLRLEQRWFAPAVAALRTGRLEAIELATVRDGNAHQWTLTRGALRKFWRRPVPLARHASQAATPSGT